MNASCGISTLPNCRRSLWPIDGLLDGCFSNRSMKALIFGNCQIPVLAKCMRTMNSNLQIEQIRTTAASSDLHHLRERFRATDKIFVMTTATDRFSELFVENSEKVLRFPRIYFPAYHPDIVHLCLAGKLVHTPLSYYNSKLVLAGFLQGLTVDETRALFTGDVFKKVGYLDAWGPSVAMFRRETRDTIFEMMDAPVKWLSLIHISEPTRQAEISYAVFCLK